jgi:hypothetical protein
MTDADRVDVGGATAHTLVELVQRADALDGYPLAALILNWPADGVSMIDVVRQVVANWRSRLDGLIADLPPGGSHILATIKSQLQQTRQALSELLAETERLQLQHDLSTRRPSFDAIHRFVPNFTSTRLH